jgi:hypothetical protein
MATNVPHAVLPAPAAAVAAFTAAPAPALPTDVKNKAYFCAVPFCNIHVMRGPGICDQLSFVAGMLETSDPQVQAHLDAICDKPGSQVTSKPATAVSQEEARMRADVRESAIKARDKMIAAGEKVA